MKKLTLTLLALLVAAMSAGAQLNDMFLVGQYVGENQNDNFGAATAMGDFDDDGYDEFIIGAYLWGYYLGKNYYYDSNGGVPVEPAWTVQGIEAQYDVWDENIGDINNDGIDDLALVELDTDTSRLHVFFGSESFDSLADWSFDIDVYLGIGPLDSCGDINGDGYNDFMVRKMLSTSLQECVIYFGGEALDTIPDWHYTSPYGYIDGLGDINGDDYADIMLLRNEYPPLLFFGGSAMDTIPDLVFGEYGNCTKAAIGDVNNDGFNDFSMVMMLPDSDSYCQPVYFGGVDVDTIPDCFLLDELGELAASPYFITNGDFNGDGISDLITGGASWIFGRVAYIYLGSPWFNPVLDAMIFGINPGYEMWGQEMATGDVNNDGRDEVLISASGWEFARGLAELFSGPEIWIDYGAAVEPSDLVYSPGRYKLYQNYPNPFNSSTTIRFELGVLSSVSLSIYSLSGQLVHTLIDFQELKPGGYNVSWNARDAASGMYLLKFQVDPLGGGQFQEIKKMILIK